MDLKAYNALLYLGWACRTGQTEHGSEGIQLCYTRDGHAPQDRKNMGLKAYVAVIPGVGMSHRTD